MISNKFKFKREDFNKIKQQKTKRVNTQFGFFVIFQSDFGIVLNKITEEVIGKKSIVVSKKVFKTAVSRNLHKRIFYNIMKDINKNETLKEKAFVFFPNKSFNSVNLKDIISENIK